jgi:hypothetical protein
MATQNLGSLGTKRAEVDIEFDYFGETIRVHPQASDLRVMDFMMRVGELDMEDPENAQEIMKAMSEQLLMQIHPDDASLFWETAKKNNQQMQDIMAVSKSIIAAVADFPTGQPSDSADGQTTTDLSSALDSLNRADRRALAKELARPVDKRTKDAERALTLLQNRPDLQVAVVRAEQARRASNSTAETQAG